jgi:hypothetical protein
MPSRRSNAALERLSGATKQSLHNPATAGQKPPMPSKHACSLPPFAIGVIRVAAHLAMRAGGAAKRDGRALDQVAPPRAHQNRQCARPVQRPCSARRRRLLQRTYSPPSNTGKSQTHLSLQPLQLVRPNSHWLRALTSTATHPTPTRPNPFAMPADAAWAARSALAEKFALCSPGCYDIRIICQLRR